MRVGLLGLLLVLTIGPGVVAQVPSPPPPWFGGRVEMPEYGFAVTLPDDWVAFENGVDIEGQVEAASDVLDPSLYSPDEVDFVSVYASEDIQLSALHATSLNTCGVGIYRVGDTPLGDVADFLYGGYVDSPTYRNTEPPRAIGLPAEAAYHVSTSALLDPTADTWGPASLYLLGAGERMIGLACTALGTRPDDDWLSIAESIEFLPAEG